MYLTNIKKLEFKALGVAVVLHLIAVIIYCLMPSSNPEAEITSGSIIKINLGTASEQNVLEVTTIAPYNIEEKAAEEEAQSAINSSAKTIPNKSPVFVSTAMEDAAPAPETDSETSPSLGNSPQLSPQIEFKEYFDSLQQVIQQSSGIPEEAARKKLKGKAILRLEFDRTGLVRTFSLKKSTGHEILDNAAIAVATKFMTEPLPTPPESLYANEKLLKFDFGIDYDPINQ